MKMIKYGSHVDGCEGTWRGLLIPPRYGRKQQTYEQNQSHSIRVVNCFVCTVRMHISQEDLFALYFLIIPSGHITLPLIPTKEIRFVAQLGGLRNPPISSIIHHDSPPPAAPPPPPQSNTGQPETPQLRSLVMRPSEGGEEAGEGVGGTEASSTSLPN